MLLTFVIFGIQFSPIWILRAIMAFGTFELWCYSILFESLAFWCLNKLLSWTISWSSQLDISHVIFWGITMHYLWCSIHIWLCCYVPVSYLFICSFCFILSFFTFCNHIHEFSICSKTVFPYHSSHKVLFQSCGSSPKYYQTLLEVWGLKCIIEFWD